MVSLKEKLSPKPFRKSPREREASCSMLSCLYQKNFHENSERTEGMGREKVETKRKTYSLMFSKENVLVPGLASRPTLAGKNSNSGCILYPSRWQSKSGVKKHRL